MLNVTNINVYYGNIHALHDMTFHVDDGEIVSLIGANGAGKSTTLKTISGLLRSRTGDIEFDGHSISRTEPDVIVRQGLTHVPEGRRIFLSMTVEENLDMGAFTVREGRKQALDDVYDRFPRLAERRSQIAGTLSGGEQQMLAMGRALMIRPKMMMLDEPSMGLAPILVSQIMDIVVELNKSGTTVLLVEQNARLALKISHRSYVVESGRIVLTDTAENLLNNEQVKRAYLGG
ncbi:MAG: ABC transporter ATP-binding protein [Oscillospiraceae bacterium]|nr:ABC transporter ATP-binding protein [Oscillospiraceae bacterium]MBQ5412497.1 ABC transporter ATP-binding protein [Oscillospiraceae bacterium]